MIRSSVDLPQPLGPSSAVSEPVVDLERDVVERGEVAEALGDVTDDDRHQAVSSFGSGSAVMRDEHEHGEQREHDRDRVGAGEVERLAALLDAERRRLRLALEPAGDDARPRRTRRGSARS